MEINKDEKKIVVLQYISPFKTWTNMCLTKSNRSQSNQGHKVGLAGRDSKHGLKAWTRTWTQSMAGMMGKSVLASSKSLAGAAPPLS